MARLLASLFALLAIGHSIVRAESDKLIEIPLKDIWALKMIGTRNVGDLAPRKGVGETTITKIAGSS